jgi:hypothetical protein
MSSGGGGQSGDTTYNWNPSMQPRWDNLLNLSERAFFPQGVDGSYPDLSTFKPYTAQRFTGPTYNERQAMANTSSMADVAPSPFSYTDIAGNNHVGNYNLATDQTGATIRGTYLNSDPYAKASNPWANANPVAERNQYSGASPYASAVKQQGMDDITGNYMKTVEPELTRQSVMAGAFGGSADQKARADAQAVLGKTLSNYGNQFDQSQYDRSANLEQQYLNSNLQNQQNNKQLGGNWFEQDQSRGSTAFQNERGRQQSASGMGYGEQGLALDRIASLLQTGAVGRQVGDQYGNPGQQNLDFNYQQTQDANNWPFKLMQMLQGTYSTAQGNTGQQTQAYGGSNLGGILGGLLGGYALTQ